MQAITRVAPATSSPVWGQLLRVKFAEEELADEQLTLALTNDGDARCVGCLGICLWLSSFVRGVHMLNLRLCLRTFFPSLRLSGTRHGPLLDSRRCLNQTGPALAPKSLSFSSLCLCL